jgi:ParB-like chromosome segregation protein Spo0J
MRTAKIDTQAKTEAATLPELSKPYAGHLIEGVMDIKDERKYQTMPDMPLHQFEALKEDIQERGILTPIDIDEEGHILDGHHRYRACKELGITDFPTIIRPGLTEEEKRLFARKSNMMRRHLNRKQIRELITAQLKETPRWAETV